MKRTATTGRSAGIGHRTEQPVTAGETAQTRRDEMHRKWLVETTGEVRRVRGLEYYLCENVGIRQWPFDEPTLSKHPILRVTEITEKAIEDQTTLEIMDREVKDGKRCACGTLYSGKYCSHCALIEDEYREALYQDPPWGKNLGD